MKIIKTLSKVLKMMAGSKSCTNMLVITVSSVFLSCYHYYSQHHKFGKLYNFILCLCVRRYLSSIHVNIELYTYNQIFTCWSFKIIFIFIECLETSRECYIFPYLVNRVCQTLFQVFFLCKGHQLVCYNCNIF